MNNPSCHLCGGHYITPCPECEVRHFRAIRLAAFRAACPKVDGYYAQNARRMSAEDLARVICGLLDVTDIHIEDSIKDALTNLRHS